MFSDINQITCIFGFLDYTGITHENIVQEANKFWNATASLQGAQVKPVFVFFFPFSIRYFYIKHT